MDYKEYMIFSCLWEKNLDIDEDTHMQRFGTKTKLKCFKYGKNVFIRQDSSSTTISAQSYVVMCEVKVGDKIDNQVVKSVDVIPDFDGKTPLYECLTWND